MTNEAYIAEAKLEKHQVVNLHNNHGGVERVAEKFIVVPYNTPRKCVATYFPEANVLVPIGSFADISKTPTSKSVVITIRAVLEEVKMVFTK